MSYSHFSNQDQEAVVFISTYNWLQNFVLTLNYKTPEPGATRPPVSSFVCFCKEITLKKKVKKKQKLHVPH